MWGKLIRHEKIDILINDIVKEKYVEGLDSNLTMRWEERRRKFFISGGEFE